MSAAARASTHRSLTCAMCNQHKHTGCECQPPVLRQVPTASDLRDPGDYYVVETKRPDREYFHEGRLRTARHEVDRQYFGLVRHACGAVVQVGAFGSLAVYLANVLRELQRGCSCRRGFPCFGRAVPIDEPALLAA